MSTNAVVLTCLSRTYMQQLSTHSSTILHLPIACLSVLVLLYVCSAAIRVLSCSPHSMLNHMCAELLCYTCAQLLSPPHACAARI